MTAFKTLATLSVGLLIACTPIKKNEDMIDQKLYQPGTPAESLAQQPVHTASELTSWELSGAIAARNQRESWTASIQWQQQGPSQYKIRLMGPLGSGTVLLERQNGLTTFRDGPKTISSTDAEQLMYKQTGVRLPISHLYYWVRGITGAHTAATKSANQQVGNIHQDGYNIIYSQYTKVKDLILPSKIKLEGHGISVKLVIKQWHF